MSYSIAQIERILQTYTLDDILEQNELTEADVLLMIQNNIEIILPVDLDETS